MKHTQKGFTLIEVLVVMGIIAILASVALIAINPARQFAQARNSQRLSNVAALINAVGQYASDHKGLFTCEAGALPGTTTPLSSKTGGYNIRPCLVPYYLPAMPLDPSEGTETGIDDYDSGYAIFQDSTTKRITVRALHAELGENVEMSR